MTRPLIVPLRLRSTGEAGRKVTWLELFFDLVFVAAVAQVAEPLRHDYTIAGLARFTPLFLLIWWAWTGQSVFATRFDTDDVVQRVLTLVQVFVVAAMAANAKDALDSRSSAGFAAAYAAVRLLLVGQYVRARTVPGARALAVRYASGHGAAAVLWLASALVPAPARFWIWSLALVVDLGTPWMAVRHSVSVPPDAAHLPERFGLFTLILLGESVVAVMQGMEAHDDWPIAAATSAFLGMAILFALWWWYFDGALAASEQPVRSRADAFRFHVWSYAHFPLSLGIVVVGVGIQRIVAAAAHATLTSIDAALLVGAASVTMAAMTTISVTSTARRSAGQLTGVHLLLACAVTIGITIATPVAMIGFLFAACAAQLGVALQPQFQSALHEHHL